MGKVFYISKNVALGLLLMAICAVITIIALSVAYDKERAKNRDDSGHGQTDNTSTPTIPTTPSTEKEPWDRYRLPDSLLPLSYNVTLWPRLEPNEDGLYIFTGHSYVVFKCVKATDLVIIHCNKLNLTSFDGHLAVLTAEHHSAPAIERSWLVPKTHYLVLQLRNALTEGSTYVLHTVFQGELADDLEGFYRSEYTENGVTKIAATSQMQATYARKAFPCFDEPAMKAVFNVTIIHSHGTIALSNGREIDTVNTISGLETKFEPTARMSTYLLAFIVCDFTYIQSTQRGIRIWARRKAIDDGQGDFALNVTGPILEFYERYYNAAYPLAKSDQIALPDFNAGAMENWGLVTYRETALLYDPIISSTRNKERIVYVIAHELAHMWFGNLVTVRWWNDLWLNEGFASYVEYLGADYVQPTWNVKDQILLYDIHGVFGVDALASSHPLSCAEEEVSTPAQISEMFSTISYKSSHKCLPCLFSQSYLNTFAFGNTVYTDLWDHLQQAVDQTPGLDIPHTVHEIMNRWTLQMGFPVVTIDTRTGSITQKHFLLDPDSVYVVIKLYLRNSTYCIMNLFLLFQALSVMNRAQIIDDAFNLARAKIINTTLALKTTKYLSKEMGYIPWDSALRNLNYYILMFDRTEVYGSYLKKQIQPLYEHFKVLTENWTKVPAAHGDQYNQINAISMGCKMGVEGCRELTKNWFKQWMGNPAHNPIHPNLKSTVYCYAIAFGGHEEWDFAWTMYKNATVASEASRLREAMACTQTPWLLNRYLEYSLNPSKIRKQDATATILYIARNIVGMPLAWDFVRARWRYIFEQYGRGSFSFAGLINGITRRFSTEFELEEVQNRKGFS
uniref:Aminopeptidase n=1 Tax=Periophthalmus magnuspinnatus TaxID=409849 RepID=A0A3B3Z7P7_9GOBI